MNLVSATQPLRSRKPLGYLVAVLLSLFAIWLRLQLDTLFETSPFLLSLVAVALATLLGGFGPGVLAAILSGLLADYFLLPPVGSLGLDGRYAWVAMAVFGAAAATLVGLVHGILVAHDLRIESESKLREMNAELEARVIERTRALEAEVAERADAEAQLRQLQKMESIGQLTGGIAHDFNNMLAIVTGSLDMARRRLTGSEHPKVASCIDNAAEGARRAAVLTARLLAFSRQQPLEPQALDANKLVSGMSELLRRTIGEQFEVETVLAGGLWHAFADAAQLENAVVNLAVNARDAMPEGGKLTIETANAHLDDHYARANPGVEPGQYVAICVSDTGIGMTRAVLERAFDPFYTTKGVGQGTGLGLSQVFGYVKQSGGHVKIYSEVGQGTTVKIYLPRHLGTAVPAEERLPAEALPQGAPERIILVVEDEEQVRHMTVDALRELGYTVVQASDGNQALEQLAVQPRIDLLFTDIVMPGMNGRQLADRMIETRPGTPILFTTGYTRNAVVHNGMLDAGVAFLPKPFTIEQLARKVHDVLAGEGANRPAA
jgi:signal transduction histidine kinase/ActR/RegA family two-component response regulator